MSGSASTQRDTSPRTTTASSTIMTRRGCCATGDTGGVTVAATLIGGTQLYGDERTAADRGSEQAYFLELRFDDFLVEGLHDVFVRPRMQSTRDMSHVILGSAEHHPRTIAARHAAQLPQEF